MKAWSVSIFKKGDVENLGRSIARIVDIFVAGGDAARRSVRQIAARPEKRLYAVLSGGGEAGAPHGGLAIVAIAFGRGSGFDAEGLGVGGVAAGGDENFVKSGASGEQLGRL